jgi:hypothetical protein
MNVRGRSGYVAVAVGVLAAAFFFTGIGRSSRSAMIRIVVQTLPSVVDGSFPDRVSASNAIVATLTPIVPQSLFSSFANWHSNIPNFGVLTPSEMAAGEQLAMLRRTALKEIIRQDPARALGWAVSPSLKQQLPARIARHIEDHLSGYGTLNIASSEVTGSSQPPIMSQAATLNGRIYAAHTSRRRRDLNTYQQRIPLWGISIDSDFAVADEAARLLSRSEQAVAEAPLSANATCVGCGRKLGKNTLLSRALLGGQVVPLCEPGHIDLLNAAAGDGAVAGFSGAEAGPLPSWTLGPKRLLYVVVQFADQSSPPTTRSSAEAALAEVNSFFNKESYGLTSIAGIVTDPLPLAKSTAEYTGLSPASLYNDAVAAARAGGWDADQHDFVFVRYVNGPGSVAFAMTGQKGAWVQTDDAGVIAHELGHNYGLNHANAWTPFTTSAYGPGSTVEYGDPFDTMGPNQGAFNPCEKTVLQWFPSWACLAITNSGIYRLRAFDVVSLQSNLFYALKVRKDVRDYWFDYRGQFTSGNFSPFTLNGLEIRWPRWSASSGGSTLLDTTPGTARGFADGPLTVGRTFSDVEAEVHVTTLGRSPTPGEWLDVVVNLGPFTNNQRPAVSLTASEIKLAVNERAIFHAVASDPDGDDLAYGWDFALGASGSLGSVFIVATNSAIQTHAWNVPGEFEVRCVVSDMKGGLAVGSVLVTVGFPTNHHIGGRVLGPGGVPVANVQVFNVPESFSPGDPAYLGHVDYRTAYTDESGRYRLVNLGTGSYNVYARPTAVHTFDRVGTAALVTLPPSASDVDFSGHSKPPRSIHGFVRDLNIGVPDVLVRAGHQATFSDANGEYTLPNLLPASYVLTATRGEDQFAANKNPVYLDTNDLASNILSRVLYRLSGQILGLNAPVVVGTGEPGRTALALPDFSDLTDSWIYHLDVPRGLWNLSAALDGFGFTFIPLGFTNPVLMAGTDHPIETPQMIQLTTFTNLHFQTITAVTYSIRGRVSSGGIPVANVTVSVAVASGVTDSLGNYSLGGLLPGNHTVRPSRPGFAFSPEAREAILSGADLVQVNFDAIRQPMEQWRTNYFTSLEQLDAAVGGDDGDPDGDGIPNLFEYAFHLHPRTPSLSGLPYATIESDYLILNYATPTNATDISYHVEGANRLPAGWSTNVQFIGESSETGSATRFVKWRHNLPLTGTNQGYLRLRVTRP